MTKKPTEKPKYTVLVSAQDGSKVLALGNDLLARKKYGEPLVYNDPLTRKLLVVFDDSCLPSKDFESETVYTIEPA